MGCREEGKLEKHFLYFSLLIWSILTVSILSQLSIQRNSNAVFSNSSKVLDIILRSNPCISYVLFKSYYYKYLFTIYRDS